MRRTSGSIEPEGSSHAIAMTRCDQIRRGVQRSKTVVALCGRTDEWCELATACSVPAHRCRSLRPEDRGALEASVVPTRERGSRRCWSRKSSRCRRRAHGVGQCGLLAVVGARQVASHHARAGAAAATDGDGEHDQQALPHAATSVLSSARPPAAPWSARRRGCWSSRSCPRGTRTRRSSRRGE